MEGSAGPTQGTDAAPAPSPRPAATATGNATPPPKPERIGSGHIIVGGPHSRIFRSLAVLGVPNVDGFFLPAPKPGTNLTTKTRDNGGLGYDLDFNFHDSGGQWLGGCATSARDEVCQVPESAARVEVVANMGADLDVEVFTAPHKEAMLPRTG